MNIEEVFQKVVFLLGAGASKDMGCKLSRDMLFSLQISIDNLSPSNTDFYDYQKAFKEIYAFILASLHYQSTLKDCTLENSAYLNIEDFVMVLRQLIDKEFVVPYPLIGNWNDKIIKWEISDDHIFDIFLSFITLQLITDWTKFDLLDAKKVLSPITRLLSSSSTIKINFFSLNYDLTFESVFNSPYARVLDDGFTERSVSGKNIKSWASDFNDPASPTKINLYKLHGSIDWEYNKTSEDISIKENIVDPGEPLIIFGSYSKMLSFDPFLYILSGFRSCLEQATVFIVIGYSFHDKYINNLLIQQLSQNTKNNIPKQLFIVDPAIRSKTESTIVSEIRDIQDSKSLNDVINFKHISPDRIKLFPITAKEFYSQYFAKDAGKLVNEIEKIERGVKVFK